MTDHETIKLALVICAGFGALAWLGITARAEERASEAARQAAQRLATELGLDLAERVPSVWLEQLPGCFVFDKGPSRMAGNRLTGDYRGWPIALFEFTHVHYRGRARQQHIDLVLVVPLDEHPLPSIQLLPLSLGEKLAEAALGTDRLVFEGSAAGRRFSREYSLWVDDRPAVEALFTAEVLRWFAGRPGWHVWSGGGHAVVWSPRWRDCRASRTAEDWRGFLDRAIDVLDVLARRKSSLDPSPPNY